MPPSSISSSDPAPGARRRIDPALVLVVVLVLLAEMGARWAADSADEQSLLSRIRAVEKDGYYPPIHLTDPVLGYRYRPNHVGRLIRTDFDNEVRTNRHGFRGPEVELDKGEATFRVALLGDSFMAANQVSVEQTWAYLLERELAPVNGNPVEIVNFAVDGYATWNQRHLLEHEVLRFRPDAVILYTSVQWMEFPWELHRAVTNRGTVLISQDRDYLRTALKDEDRKAYSLRRLLASRSYLSRLFSVLAGKKPVDEPSMHYTTPHRARRHSIPELVREMRDLSARDGATFGVFYRAGVPEGSENHSASLEIPFATDLGLLSSYSGLTWPNDAHLNVKGNRVYAEKVAPAFDALLESLAAGSPSEAPGP